MFCVLNTKDRNQSVVYISNRLWAQTLVLYTDATWICLAD